MRLIMTCVMSVQYFVLVNGRLGETFTPSRGLRQGNPLSPYHYLLCVEGFNPLMDQANKRGALKGLEVIRGGTRINHLLFADDCVFFRKVSKEE